MPYTRITETEMDNIFLENGFEAIDIPGTKEKVYQFEFNTKSGERFALRIYSSIDLRTGDSRGCGNDAIRVMVMWKNGNEWTRIGSTRRVNRIQTWKKNLENQLNSWTSMLEGKCEDCGAPLSKRRGKHGEFLGCARYPECNYTESL